MGVIRNLSPLDQLGDDGEIAKLHFAAIHSTAHASMIHLHEALFTEASVVSSNAVLSHAFEILAVLEVVDTVTSRVLTENGAPMVLDPFLAVSFLPSCVDRLLNSIVFVRS